MLTFTPKIYKK